MPTITPVRVASIAMRTRFEIVLWDAARTDSDLYAAGEEALREVAETETLLSAYRTDAALFRLNEQIRLATGAFYPPPRLRQFLSFALTTSVRTGGAFDPTLGNADAVSRPEADTDALHITRPGVRFDAGAIGKGYALDRARDALVEAGVGNALLHGGTSSVLALGSEPGGGDWRVAVASPEPDEPPAAVWRLRDGDAMGVSANIERARHIIDPRTGRPVSSRRLAAVLISGSATLADAISTALLVTGDDGITALRSAFPEVREWLVAQKESAAGNTKKKT